jgi:Flp pilus assembly protein TadD
LNFAGYVLADHGIQLERAHRLLLRAAALRPEDPAILDSLGWCALRLGKLGEAMRLLQEAGKLRPNDPEILHHLAELQLKQGRRAEAVSTWEKALLTLQQDPDPYLQRLIEERVRGLRSSKAGRVGDQR